VDNADPETERGAALDHRREAELSRLLNKVALITGAAGGIGRATVERFHAEGATVIATDINDAAGEELVRQFSQGAEYRHLDVTREEEWALLFRQLEGQCGRLDILVNNAGVDGYTQTKGPHNPEYLDLESWQHVHAVNSLGVAVGCKYAIGLMKKGRRGSIVNVSSRSGIVGVPHLAAYAASKAAVRNHTKSVALYCARKGYNIRCNSIHPAAILTPMWDHTLGEGAERERRIEELSRQIPLGRMGTALDVANAVVYLASDESEYVTGIELVVDGGILAGSAATPLDDR
jgi:3(or 17)beta-hydroxysteroid dehydrogenase